MYFYLKSKFNEVRLIIFYIEFKIWLAPSSLISFWLGNYIYKWKIVFINIIRINYLIFINIFLKKLVNYFYLWLIYIIILFKIFKKFKK